MQPDSIVEDFDVFGNSPSGFCLGGEDGAVNEFVFQCAEKGFGERIIPALPDPSHGAPQV